MDFSELLFDIRDANKAEMEALKCAAIILRRAQKIPLNQRGDMIELVKELISVHCDDNSVVNQDQVWQVNII